VILAAVEILEPPTGTYEGNAARARPQNKFKAL